MFWMDLCCTCGGTHTYMEETPEQVMKWFQTVGRRREVDIALGIHRDIARSRDLRACSRFAVAGERPPA